MMETRIDRLYSVIDLAILLGHQHDFNEILRLVTEKAASLVRSDVTLIVMLNPQTRQTMKTLCAEGQDISDKKFHLLNANLTGWVLENQCTFVTGDLKHDSRFRKGIFRNTSVKSALCIPLCMESTILGTLVVLNETRMNLLTTEDQMILEKLAAVASPFLHNVQKLKPFFVAPVTDQTLQTKYEALGLLGKCQKFMDLLHAVEAAARCDVRVLLEGKSGTGKELIARAIHACSDRNACPFIAVDCGAIPEHLMESELFGHVRGAFTGASMARKGLFEAADHGTLFMDEITNLPMDLQAKLLRVLQEGEIRPLGSNAPRKIDVRVITAASTPLRALVDTRAFREDLFYRLLVYPIHVPSLDERQEDIPLLASHFLKQFTQKQQKAAEYFHEEILDLIQRRPWPGNIRELENFVERLVTLTPADRKQVDTPQLPQEFQFELKRFRKHHPGIPAKQSLNGRLAELEKDLVLNALIECNWNQSRAARMLKISEPAIRSKMKKHGLSKNP
jgi:Nif-specific regulatory protein